MKPGLYNMPANTYHADPAPTPSLSASLCTILLDQSPAHAFAAHPRLDGSKIFKPTVVTDNGSLAHSLLLEGHVAQLVEIDAENYRTKAAQVARDDAYREGKIPALPPQVGAIKGMAAAGRRVWTRTKGLTDYPPEAGLAEHSGFWVERDADGTEFWFRFRPDWLSADHRVAIDAKFTARSVRPDRFAKQMMAMDYHTRAAFYRRGIKALFGVVPRYPFLVVEQQAPHEGAVIELDDTFLALGEERVEQAIALWKQCIRTGKWPGYGEEIHLVAPPDWAVSDDLNWDESPELETQA